MDVDVNPIYVNGSSVIGQLWITLTTAAKKGIVDTDNNFEIEMEGDDEVDIDTGARHPFAALRDQVGFLVNKSAFHAAHYVPARCTQETSISLRFCRMHDCSAIFLNPLGVCMYMHTEQARQSPVVK